MAFQRAFSLVELSIVLVILGLLVGGILAGQSLIHAAELRAVSAEQARYAGAIHAFRDKYLGLPGDIANATSFWGDNASKCASAATADGTPGVCNGNGDGTIPLNSPGSGLTSERMQLWLQLQQAGLIEGAYTGVEGNNGTPVLDSNIPSSRYPNGSWMAASFGNQGNGQWVTLNYNNALIYGAVVGSVSFNYRPVTTPLDTWNLDVKLDDGVFANGNFIGANWGGTCGTGGHGATNPQGIAYNLTNTGTVCQFVMRNQF